MVAGKGDYIYKASSITSGFFFHLPFFWKEIRRRGRRLVIARLLKIPIFAFYFFGNGKILPLISFPFFLCLFTPLLVVCSSYSAVKCCSAVGTVWTGDIATELMRRDILGYRRRVGETRRVIAKLLLQHGYINPSHSYPYT